jgi:hypothetical protein
MYMNLDPSKKWIGQPANMTFPDDDDGTGGHEVTIVKITPLMVKIGPRAFKKVIETSQRKVYLRFDSFIGSRLPHHAIIERFVPPDLLQLGKIETKDSRGFVRVNAEILLAYEVVSGNDAVDGLDSADFLGDSHEWGSLKLRRLISAASSELEAEVLMALLRIESKMDLMMRQIERVSNKKSVPRLTSQIVNISGSGIAFQVSEPYSVGAKLKAYIDLGQSYGQPLTILGEVVRCTSINNAGHNFGPFRLAVKFINIPERAQDRIVAFTLKRQQMKLRKVKS